MNGKRWQAIAACGLSLGLGVALAQEEAKPAARERRGVEAAARERQGGREFARARADARRGGPFADLEAVLDDPDQLKDIGLTPEQVATLKSGFSAIAQRRAALQEAMEAAGTEQARQMTAESIDEEGVMKAVEEAGRLRTDIAKLHAQQLILTRKTLSNEQMERVRQRRRQQMVERLRAQRGARGDEGEGEEGARIRPRGPGGADAEARRQAMRDKLRDRRQRQRPAPDKAEDGGDSEDLVETR